MSDLRHLYLCFFADSKHWDNVILTAAYPSGFTYFRPFRYRDTWVQGEVLHDLEDEAKRTRLLGQEAILAMRFLEEGHRWLLLPIRKISLTGIDYAPGLQLVYFKVGPLIDFRKFGNLAAACLELPREEHLDQMEPPLFLRSAVATPPNAFVEERHEDAAWIVYADLIGTDKSVPIAPEASHGLFLRFNRPIGAAEPRVAELYGSSLKGKQYGFCLKEGTPYDLVVYHRFPSLIGTHGGVGPLAVEYSAPSGSVHLGNTREQYTGNYDKHVVTVMGQRAASAPEQIIIGPAADTIAADDSTARHTVPLVVPVRVIGDFWYQVRVRWLWILMFVLASVIASLWTGNEWVKALLAGFAAILLVAVKERSF